MEEIKEEVYYSELQATLRNYDMKLWQIPGLFFAVVTLVLANFDSSCSVKNIVILFFGISFLFLLILFFYKAHFFHILIQKKINEFDRVYNKKDEKIERIPLTSIPPDEIKNILDKLKKDPKAKFYSTPLQEFLIKQTVTSWIKIVMWLTVIYLILNLVHLLNNNFLLNIWHIFF